MINKIIINLIYIQKIRLYRLLFQGVISIRLQVVKVAIKTEITKVHFFKILKRFH